MSGIDIADYHAMIARKRVRFEPRGFEPTRDMNSRLFPHQIHCVEFLLRAGCGAAFLDTGLGKTFVSLEWARHVNARTGRRILMLAPLAVGPQHAREAEKFGIEASYLREPTGSMPPIVITNYERLHLFDAGQFDGVILDESSILKSFAGKTKRALIETFKRTPYRLACTATPAPNDHMELGNHADFLGVMTSSEMLARWFLADQSEMGRYRLKAAAGRSFWDWMASWSRCLSLPSDIGFTDDGFQLPPMKVERHVVPADLTLGAGEDAKGQGQLFRDVGMTATSVHREKRYSLTKRADVIAENVLAEPDESWVIWCETDDEADAMTSRIPGSVEVRGSMTAEVKERRLVDFSEGRTKVLVTKPKIAGFGLNWQHCARMAFVSLSFSYEAWYQAVRRCWRFGQSRAVLVHVAMSETESRIHEIVARKSDDHEAMKRDMRAAMARAVDPKRALEDYDPREAMQIPRWLA